MFIHMHTYVYIQAEMQIRYHKIHIIKIHTSAFFNILTKSGNYHCSLILRCLQHLTPNQKPISGYCPLPSPPSPSMSLRICLVHTVHKNRTTWPMIFYDLLLSFTFECFQVFPRCNMNHYFTLFHGQVIFHYVGILLLA